MHHWGYNWSQLAPLLMFKAPDAILVPDQLHPDTEGYCGMTVHFVAGESGKLGGRL